MQLNPSANPLDDTRLCSKFNGDRCGFNLLTLPNLEWIVQDITVLKP